MSIEMIFAIIGISVCAYGLGYYFGYKNCFEYLKSELEKFRKND